MTAAAKKLLNEALSLSVQEQRWLTQRLLDAAPVALDAAPVDQEEVRCAWNQLAAQRLEEAERSETEPVSYADVQAHARALLANG